jgi:hypothetical protein
MCFSVWHNAMRFRFFGGKPSAVLARVDRRMGGEIA